MIWGHSFMNGFVSGNESGAIVRLVTPLAQSLQVYDTDLVTFIVRKCAHFTEYLILGSSLFLVGSACELLLGREVQTA